LSVDLAVFRGVRALYSLLAYIQASWVLPRGVETVYGDRWLRPAAAGGRSCATRLGDVQRSLAFRRARFL